MRRLLPLYVVILLATAVPSGAVGTEDRSCDLDGDGFDDLVIGEPNGGGQVTVLYGSAGKVGTAGADQFDVGTAGLPLFGWVAECVDFDGDGRDDLAVGAPGAGGTADVPFDDSGALYAFDGTSAGVDGDAPRLFHRNIPGVVGKSEAGLDLGRRVAVGDFDGDGHGDVAIAARYDDIGAKANAGSVSVLFGKNSGLGKAGDQLWHANSAGIKGKARTNAYFGTSLAVGDFDGDGRDDLAIGEPGATARGEAQAGAVHVLYGGTDGLKAGGDQLIHRGTPGVKGAPHGGDGFAKSLSSGDFDGDGFDDLVVGAPFENVEGSVNAGTVQVMYGSPDGVAFDRDKVWSRASANIKGPVVPGGFGEMFATGDFDGDGRSDLAVGMRRENRNGLEWVGAVNVIYGSGSGLKAAGNQLWRRDTKGVLGDIAMSDEFGKALIGRDFDGDGRDDLAVAGGAAINILYGDGDGLTTAGDQYFDGSTAGMPPGSLGGHWWVNLSGMNVYDL